MALHAKTQLYQTGTYLKIDKVEWNSYKENETHSGDDNRKTVVVTLATYSTREDRIYDPASSKLRESITIRISLEDILTENFLEICYNKIKTSQIFTDCTDV